MSENDNFTMAEAIAEAKRCLNCKVPQCKMGCPIGNEIPQWVHELSMGNLGNSISIINTRSNLPAVCGRVCGHERQCEGHCVLNKKGKHIEIGKLERFVADFDTKMGLTHVAIPEKSRGSVAIIGTGPAGLTVAGELARRGFRITMFEMDHEPGGDLMFGIPEYRLPKSVVRAEIQKIKNLGVTIFCNTTVGRDITIDDIFARGFDAIFIGSGTGKPKSADIPGVGLKGVRHAIYFLRRMELFNDGFINRDEVYMDPGDRVYVVGGGNTAMDAARTAARLGADVTVLYHRTQDRMAALKAEQEGAAADGVKFQFEASITDIVDTNGDGRLDQITIQSPEGTKTVPAERVLLAVGSVPASRIVSTTTGIDVDPKGYVLTRDEPYGMTSRKGVFAGGDVAHRPATVVQAMGNAREVAEGIARYVDAIRLLDAVNEPNPTFNNAPGEN